MSTISTGRSRVGGTLRAVLVALLILAPLGYVSTQFWLANGEKADAVDAERGGVEYLRPTLTMVATLTTTQSAAVAGREPDANALRAVERDMDRVDGQYGRTLGTSTRWGQLRGQIEQLIEQPRTGASAFRTYSDVIDLAGALIEQVDDTSMLEVDEHLASHHLALAVVHELPELLTNSGRYADLLTLSASARDEERDAFVAQAAVARDRVGRLAGEVDEGVRKSLSATGDRQLGPDLLGRIDEFRNSAGAIAPLVQLAETPDPLPDAAVVQSQRELLDKATVELGRKSLEELNSLLDQRGGDIDLSTILVVVAVVLGVAVAGFVLWRLLPPAQRDHKLGTPDDDGQDGADDDEEYLPLDRQSPEGRVDPNDLIDLGELMRVGRAVRRTNRESEDDLQ